MRTVILATVLAFQAPVAAGPVPKAARHVARQLATWLDARRRRIDGE